MGKSDVVARESSGCFDFDARLFYESELGHLGKQPLSSGAKSGSKQSSECHTTPHGASRRAAAERVLSNLTRVFRDVALVLASPVMDDSVLKIWDSGPCYPAAVGRDTRRSQPLTAFEISEALHDVELQKARRAQHQGVRSSGRPQACSHTSEPLLTAAPPSPPATRQPPPSSFTLRPPPSALRGPPPTPRFTIDDVLGSNGAPTHSYEARVARARNANAFHNRAFAVK